jgi:ABC-type nitrate/sulfonate/bicarbonate transport system substrate-binding protein
LKNNLKRYIPYLVLLVVLVGLGALLLFGFNTESVQKNTSTAPQNFTAIRIGWQTTWATQGQLSEVLQHTDILNKNGLNGTFSGFISGAPLNIAALAGQVDVLFTADAPAASLLSKSNNWVIIGRLMYNRVAIYVPPQSPITNVSGLKGKTVGMPFGTASQIMAFEAENAAGLNPQTDVNNVNLGINEQAFLVNSANAVKWGNYDAFAGYDPTPAIFQVENLSRNIYIGKVVSVIMMSKSYIAAHPQAPIEFLKAFNDAYTYYRANTSQANSWFINASGLNVTQGELNLSASIEPNLNATSGIRIGFVPSDYQIMQDTANFMYVSNMISTNLNITSNVNLQYIEEAGLK